MTNVSTSYTLANELFDTFRGKSDLISPEELANSGVVIRAGQLTDVEGIVAFGRIDDVRASQRLSLGTQGMFYLTTVLNRSNDSYRVNHITHRSEAGLETLTDSFFVEAFSKIIKSRQLD